MDVEKTVRFLLDQQAVFASRMGALTDRMDALTERVDSIAAGLDELRGVVHELAVNQVALGKAQVRFDQNLQKMQERQQHTDATVQVLVQQIERLVRAMDGRFPSDGSSVQ